MTETPARRAVLKTAAGLAIATTTLSQASRAAAETPVSAQARPKLAPGKPGDFDWLAGEWRIQHRRFKPDTGMWDEFEGEATCWTILGGVGSVEELRIPARDFSGMGLRLLDLESKVWSDFWVNAKSGVLGAAGLTGGFVDGVGIFDAEDKEGDVPVIYRGVWDQITGKSHRWRQTVSKDGGKSWDDNWLMAWTKV